MNELFSSLCHILKPWGGGGAGGEGAVLLTCLHPRQVNQDLGMDAGIGASESSPGGSDVWPGIRPTGLNS